VSKWLPKRVRPLTRPRTHDRSSGAFALRRGRARRTGGESLPKTLDRRIGDDPAIFHMRDEPDTWVSLAPEVFHRAAVSDPHHLEMEMGGIKIVMKPTAA